MPDPKDVIQPGDWVVWSDYHNQDSDRFRKDLGSGPFRVREVNKDGNIKVHANGHVHGYYFGPRFRKDTFITAVKKALKDA